MSIETQTLDDIRNCAVLCRQQKVWHIPQRLLDRGVDEPWFNKMVRDFAKSKDELLTLKEKSQQLEVILIKSAVENELKKSS